VKPRSAGVLATVLLSAAALLAGIAWQTQSNAARNLSLAYELSGRDLPESDSSPPSIESNEKVIQVLSESIGIRRDIDGLLQRVESDVEYLRGAQEDANATTESVRSQLVAIAEKLGIAVGAADTSAGKLAHLDGRLAESARLARAIERELAELDRKLGPSVGRRP
jgi:hypothetical protein